MPKYDSKTHPSRVFILFYFILFIYFFGGFVWVFFWVFSQCLTVSMSRCVSCRGESKPSLKPIFETIAKATSTFQLQGGDAALCVVIDDASLLEVAARGSTEAVLDLVHYCRTLRPSPASSVRSQPRLAAPMIGLLRVACERIFPMRSVLSVSGNLLALLLFQVARSRRNHFGFFFF